MANLLRTLATLARRARDNGASTQDLALAARSLVNPANEEVILGDNLALTLTNLLGSAGAADAISTLTSATDLTTSGVLTTLGTNVGAHDTQGVTLFAALIATTAAGSVVAVKTDLVSASTPLTAGTVTAGSGKVNETLYIAPAATIAALTVTFPSNANSQIGQKLTVFSTQIVTTLTVSSSGLTLLGTALTALAATTPYTWQKVAASTWARLQ